MIEFLLTSKIEGTIMKNILFFIGIVSVAIAVPSIMVSIAYTLKEKRIFKNHSKIS